MTTRLHGLHINRAEGGHADADKWLKYRADNRAKFEDGNLLTLIEEPIAEPPRVKPWMIVAGGVCGAGALLYLHFRDGWPLWAGILTGLFTIGLYVFFSLCKSAPVVDGFEIMEREEAE